MTGPAGPLPGGADFLLIDPEAVHQVTEAVAVGWARRLGAFPQLEDGRRFMALLLDAWTQTGFPLEDVLSGDLVLVVPGSDGFDPASPQRWGQSQ